MNVLAFRSHGLEGWIGGRGRKELTALTTRGRGEALQDREEKEEGEAQSFLETAGRKEVRRWERGRTGAAAAAATTEEEEAQEEERTAGEAVQAAMAILPRRVVLCLRLCLCGIDRKAYMDGYVLCSATLHLRH
jgi:hypothetical protein